MLFFTLSLLLVLGAQTVAAQGPSWNAVPFNMQSIPLAVKNPCNNVWAPQASGPAQVSSAGPRQWDTNLNVRHQLYAHYFLLNSLLPVV